MLGGRLEFVAVSEVYSLTSSYTVLQGALVSLLSAQCNTILDFAQDIDAIQTRLGRLGTIVDPADVGYGLLHNAQNRIWRCAMAFIRDNTVTYHTCNADVSSRMLEDAAGGVTLISGWRKIITFNLYHGASTSLSNELPPQKLFSTTQGYMYVDLLNLHRGLGVTKISRAQ